jgi:hypothetical protein
LSSLSEFRHQRIIEFGVQDQFARTRLCIAAFLKRDRDITATLSTFGWAGGGLV